MGAGWRLGRSSVTFAVRGPELDRNRSLARYRRVEFVRDPLANGLEFAGPDRFGFERVDTDGVEDEARALK